MPNKSSEPVKLSVIFRAVLITALGVILPNSAWSFFGWSIIFQPLIAFFVLSRFGAYTGRRILFAALVLSLPAFMVDQNYYLFLLSTTFLLAGLVLHRSAALSEGPAHCGLKMAAVAGLGWILLWYGFSLVETGAPYIQLITSITGGIDEAIAYYQKATDISAETSMIVVSTLYQMKEIIPVILPSVLGSLVLLLTWFTMVVGNILVPRSGKKAPWPSYQFWKLPDRLIWFVIGSGLISLLPLAVIQPVAINSLILLSVVYCYQGLAITVFFMNRWNVPILLRSFIYVMIIFQSLGTVVLLILGIAESWFDFRKLRSSGIAQQ